MYGGHDFDRWEQEMRSHALPGWPSTFARCTKRISIRGFASTASQVSRLTELLGHPPRSYAEFAADAALRWRAAA